MRIAFVSFWHSEKMGYSDNMLPKAMARLGHEVHLLTSTAQIYFDSPLYDTTYRAYLGPPVVEEGRKTVDGYTLHRLPFDVGWGIKIRGLIERLEELKPDIVQTFDIDRTNVYALAVARERLGYRLFTEMHFHASVFPGYRNRSLLKKLKWFIKTGRFLGRINKETSLCYPIARDCADIARVVYEVPENKLKIQSLGTDTELFKPAQSVTELDRRAATRKSIGFSDEDIVCIYTGRIARDKGPHILAKACETLRAMGEDRFKALFVGTGEPDEVKYIAGVKGCFIRDFVPVFELPDYYQASDIAVWPAQESTSQLDAIASGLPLIINDTVTVKERVDGSGLLYKLGSHEDLAKKLLELKNSELRAKMGRKGAETAFRDFSWHRIAKDRVADYQHFKSHR